MTAETRSTVRVQHRFSAPAETVFDAWLNPSTAGKFLFATKAGEMVRVEIDPHVGGSFIFVDRRGGEDIEHVGQYLEISRPRRLVFSFAVPKYWNEHTRVSIDIAPMNTECQLTLLHENVLTDYADRTQSGWGEILNALERELG